MKIGGLDIGTTGCKFTVFDEKGRYLNKAYRDYPVKRRMGSHEVDVSVVMDAVYAVLKEMAALYPDIAGIGVTSFGETFVCTDENGIPLLPAMLYTDPRGSEECQELVNRLGEVRIAEITGLRPHEQYSISKIMWVKKNHPEIYEKTKHIFLMVDYVIFHLTGESVIDYSLASRTMAFDIQKLEWSREIFEVAGIDQKILSRPVPTGTDAGTVSAKAAISTGLSKDTRVIAISHDQVAASVGAGAFEPSTGVDGAGTVECLTPIFKGLPDIRKMSEGYFSVVPYVVPGTYVSYAFSYTGGALIQWCTDTLGRQEKVLAAKQGISVNELLERQYESQRGDHPGSLLVLPYFAGAATPYMDTGAQGAIIGLTMDSTVSDIYRACMEGIVYEMYLNLQLIRKAGVVCETLRATGGGAHSRVWMQMKADVLDLPITALKTVDAGTVGSAMLTGIAIDLFRDLEDAAAHMVEKTDVYEPRHNMHEVYMQMYEKYKRLYSAVRPLM